MLDKNLVKEILEVMVSNGADFGEVFAENTQSNGVSLLNGVVENAQGGVSQGVGLRAIFGEKVIYSYTNILTRENLLKIAKDMSKAVLVDSKNIIVKPFVDIELENRHKILLPPKAINKKLALDKLKAMDKHSKAYSDFVTETAQSYLDKLQNVLIANTNGVFVEDTRNYIRATHKSIASEGSEKQVCGYLPGAHSGFEFFESLDGKKIAEETAESAVTMLKAGYAKGGKMPVVIDNGFGGVIFHEACGHSLEATFIAQKSSVFTDKLGEKIANSKVTAIDDGTIANKWGSINIDDEGTKTQRNVLIENGVLKSYLVDMHNGKKMGMNSTGSGRRESYKFAPTSRMTNTYIDKGTDTRDDIFNSIDTGLYAKKMGGGSVNPATGEFNFAVLEGYMIRNGKIAEPVRGATLIGKGQEVLFDIDMISDNLGFDEGNCGSSSGIVPTCVGQPLLRVSSITVGGR